MFTDLLIVIAAAIAAGAVVYLSIFLEKNMRIPTEELNHIEKQINDFPHLPMQTESFFGTKPINNDDAIIKTLGIKSPSEVLQYDALKKGVLSVNEARRIAGIEPVNEFQKAVDVGGSTIRRAINCPNCGANLTQNGVCAYCGTTYN